MRAIIAIYVAFEFFLIVASLCSDFLWEWREKMQYKHEMIIFFCYILLPFKMLFFIFIGIKKIIKAILEWESSLIYKSERKNLVKKYKKELELK